MKLTNLVCSAAIMIIASSMPPAQAHHSIAYFNGGKTVKISGVVKEFHWINPHVTLLVEGTANTSEAPQRWAVEMQAPNSMLELGWTQQTLAAGDKVTIIASPLRKKDPPGTVNIRVLYVGITLPSGLMLGNTGEH